MPTYGTTDRCTGGTATAEYTYSTYVASNAVDDNAATMWQQNTSATCWWKYDFGAGVSWKISKVTIQNLLDYGVKNFTIHGSNNDTNWTLLYTGIAANNETVQAFNFTVDNKIAYRYIKITGVDVWGSPLITYKEVEMIEGIYPSGGGIGIGNPYIF